VTDSPALGIDLGTTNSVVAVADGKHARVLADAEGRRLIPSVVSFHPDGSILVGHEARERRLVDAENTVYSTKRLIGRPFDSDEVQRAKARLAFGLEASAQGGVQVRVRRGSFALPEISAMVLRHLRSIAEQELGVACTRAVITVPANFNELQRSATQAAGKVAGLDVMRVLNEPTAATLAYGYGRDKPETIAVYDFGGGTFDLTILELDKDAFEVVSTAGDTFLGGDDIDIVLADRMCEQCLTEHRYDPKTDPQTYERMRAAAEWAKCQLSAVQDVDVTLEELFQDNRGRTIDFTFHTTREELDALARPLIARSFDVVDEALRAAGKRPKEIDSIVLVGGSTRMLLVRDMVAEHFGKKPRFDIDPDLVVAQGAAIHAYTLRGTVSPSQAPNAAAQALARAVQKKKSGSNMPSPKGMPGVRVPAPPKQPAFAPEDPRDELVKPQRGGTAPLGLVAAQRVAPPIMAPPIAIGAEPSPLSLMNLDPVATPPKKAVATREPTLRIGTGNAAAPIAPPAPPPPPQRAAPPPVPPPRPPDPQKIHDALFAAGRPNVAPDAFDAKPDPSWASFDIASLPPSEPIGFAPTDSLPMPELAPSPQAVAPRQPVVEMPDRPAPLLMDVTPLALGLETAGGYVQHVVGRNAPVPTEKTRVFSTGRDNQTEVEIRICQGDSNQFAQNQPLGAITLANLRSAARGQVRIEVTFMIDASGILDVKATDLDTKSAQTIRVSLKGGVADTEIAAMQARQAQLFPGG
jgi:molecular chaperone DnaK